MAAFSVGGKIRLVRNHEVAPDAGKAGSAIGDRARSYDTTAPAGTTTLVIDPVTRELERDWVSLSGTLKNCAGGPTPWGTWISCEETTLGAAKGRGAAGAERGGFGREHGYCFEVPAAGEGQAAPVPLRAMGRFVHEAVAVDPATGIVYETEDRGTAGFYRFLPDKPGSLGAGGRLQMLAVEKRPGYDTRKGQRVGTPLAVTWVDIDDPDPKTTPMDERAVYRQGIARGAATFARLEGCWHSGGSIFLNATSGGDTGRGQVWRYRPTAAAGGELTLLFESPGPEVLNMPDNLCVSPRGGLVLCEDNDDGVAQYVRGLTPDGRIFDLAKNIVPGFEAGEFAGATFSPDGETLFLNIQSPGLTCAIWGPWKQGAL